MAFEIALSIFGLLVAIGIFLGALRLVGRARKGNQRVRELQHDPHVGRTPDGKPTRDIEQ